eukprot:11893337-Alexandrium_andersonii.AAC.1
MPFLAMYPMSCWCMVIFKKRTNVQEPQHLLGPTKTTPCFLLPKVSETSKYMDSASTLSTSSLTPAPFQGWWGGPPSLDLPVPLPLAAGLPRASLQSAVERRAR